MSLFPRFPTGEFTPLFRLLDDYASHQLNRPSLSQTFPSTTPLRTFQPRFDVKELKDSYELQGELPGIDQKDVTIEFTDPQTLSIRGRTEHVREEGQRPAALEASPEQHQRQGKLTGPRTATVEDDEAAPKGGDTTMAGANPDAATDVTTTTTNDASEQAKKQPQPQHRYWISERSVGEFQRSFEFPSRVDQDGVKASLKNGVLSILVPKAQAPTSRRINIE